MGGSSQPASGALRSPRSAASHHTRAMRAFAGHRAGGGKAAPSRADPSSSWRRAKGSLSWHEWRDSARTEGLLWSLHRDELEMALARQRWRKATNVILAANRFRQSGTRRQMRRSSCDEGKGQGADEVDKVDKVDKVKPEERAKEAKTAANKS